MGEGIQRNKYYLVILLELMTFPLFYVISADFAMRASIPALFILMVYVIQFLTGQAETKEIKYRKIILAVVLMIGTFTPLSEMNRSLVSTMSNNDILQEQIYSFGDIQVNDEHRITVAKNQYFMYEYENSFFFKYLAK